MCSLHIGRGKGWGPHIGEAVRYPAGARFLVFCHDSDRKRLSRFEGSAHRVAARALFAVAARTQRSAVFGKSLRVRPAKTERQTASPLNATSEILP